MGSTTITRNNPTGQTLYFHVQKLTGEAWDASSESFVTWNGANIDNYDVPMVQIAGDLYGADFPSDITPINAWYVITIRSQDGASPSSSDLIIDTLQLYWTGVSLDESVSASTTNIALLRMLLNDPDDGNSDLSDSNYTQILSVESNIYRAAALAARAIAAQYAKKVKLTAGPVSIANQQKFEHYQSLALKYDSRAREGGGGSGTGYKPRLTGISYDEMETQREDTDRTGSKFPEGWDSFERYEPEAVYERDSA